MLGKPKPQWKTETVYTSRVWSKQAKFHLPKRCDQLTQISRRRRRRRRRRWWRTVFGKRCVCVINVCFVGLLDCFNIVALRFALRLVSISISIANVVVAVVFEMLFELFFKLLLLLLLKMIFKFRDNDDTEKSHRAASAAAAIWWWWTQFLITFHSFHLSLLATVFISLVVVAVVVVGGVVVGRT